MVYLDNAATTRVCPEAAEAAIHMMTECFGNPSTTYKLGREAKAAVDKARSQIAKALGCRPDEIYFTSCGSEGDNWALISGARSMRRRGKHIISSAVEHDAVRKSLDFLEKEGYEITRLQPDGAGAIPLERVRAALRPDTILVSLMMVNNETGAVNDIAAVARMLKAENSIALLHTDAVQGYLKVPFSAKTLAADLLTISGHKIHARHGSHAAYRRLRRRDRDRQCGNARGYENHGRAAHARHRPADGRGGGCDCHRRRRAAHSQHLSARLPERGADELP